MRQKEKLDFFPLNLTPGTPVYEAWVAVKVEQERERKAREAFALIATPLLAAKGVTAPPGTRIVYGFLSATNPAYAFSKGSKEGTNL